jgi:molecular chaperone GrpE
VTLAINRALDYLARQGVQPVDPLGQPFDPELHEALFEAEAADRAPGTVMQVLDRGYRRGERALRAARVVVARAPAEGGD